MSHQIMHVCRAFAFLDLCGFTAYAEDRGDGHAVAILTGLRACVRETVEGRQVRVVKWLGDGAMLCGSAAQPLVASVLEIRDAVAQRSPLPLRAGIAQGHAVIFEGDDYVGRAVNIAARLCSRAAPNQVLATTGIAEQVEDLVTLRPLPALTIAGLARPIVVHELLTAPASPRHDRPPTGTRATTG